MLEKETLRRNPRALHYEGRNVRWMFRDHTSGTTGTSLDIGLSRRVVRTWYALFEARWRRWYGVSRQDRWTILGGQLVKPVSQHKPPFRAWNRAMNKLYISTYYLAPDRIPHYLDALRRYEIKYLWGYTSALHTLAWTALGLGRKDLQMVVAITNAEPVFAYQCTAIEEAFQCPVRETYDMAEAVMADSECEAGRPHTRPKAGGDPTETDDL